MKRLVAFLLITFVFTSLACNLPVLGAPEPTLDFYSTPIISLTPIPTDTLELATPTFPPPPTPTPQPTETPLPGFSETFDGPLKNWSAPTAVTTQAINGKLTSTNKMTGGMWVFTIRDKETYLYSFYETAIPVDMYVESRFQMDDTAASGVALVCREQRDQSAWYEVRISGIGGYTVFRYEKARRTQKNNPYVQLAEGDLSNKDFHRGEFNRVRFTCQGSNLAFDINQGTKVISLQDNAITDGGKVGIGVITYATVPITVKFDSVEANVP
jgi:hypothetical protein